MKNRIRIVSIIALLMACLLVSQAAVMAETETTDERYYFDTHYKIDKDKGFSLDEKEKIKEKDPHYGWDLGSLYVSGYTQRTENEDGNPVFLKNAGDKVVLGFNLTQDINKLNGDDTLSIGYDKKGYDSYFEVSKTDFGRGTLIVRHTDYQNATGDPIVYTDYLSADSEVNANTTVELNEEGDYEVALDYVIKESPRKVFGKEVLPKTSDYTIRLFKFSVRNGNSMVFPFDIATGEELSNKAFTENGFRIDLAKSHYLKVFVKRDILDGNETEDTRENKPAKDGAKYTDEGVYTVTVEDPSTGQTTTKKIYVGSDDRYKAYVTTGLPLEEIDAQLASGASIAKDGTIVAASGEQEPDEQVILDSESDTVAGESSFPIIPLAVGLIALLVLLVIVKSKGRKKKTTQEKDAEDI